jgi:hypothetical protein
MKNDDCFEKKDLISRVLEYKGPQEPRGRFFQWRYMFSKSFLGFLPIAAEEDNRTSECSAAAVDLYVPAPD